MPRALSRILLINVRGSGASRIPSRKASSGAAGEDNERERSGGRPWTSDEDERLRKEVLKHSEPVEWVKIAQNVGGGRTNRGCIQRWMNHLNVGRRGQFGNEEIRRILELSKQYPGQWTRIARELGSGRTAQQVRELSVNRLCPERLSGKWSTEEDDRLRAAVAACGVGRWVEIAKIVQGRSDTQCLERWSISLSPQLRTGTWTEEEDERLLRAVATLSARKEYFNFGQVAEMMGGDRSRKSCRGRYKRLVADARTKPAV